MKALFLLPLLLGGVVSLAQAQTAIPAGTTALGGGIGYSRQTESSTLTGSGQTESTNSQFRVSPTAGFFVADNLAVGVNLSYSIWRVTNSARPEYDLDASTALRVGPYAQYYKMLSEQFGMVGTLGAGYQRSATPSYSGAGSAVNITSSGYYASLTPGIVFFPVPKFGISASMGYLGYDRVSVKPSSNDRTISNFGAFFGLDQLSFGGTVYFGR